MFFVIFVPVKLKLQIIPEVISFVSAWDAHDYIYRDIVSCIQKVIRVCGRM